MTDTKTQEFYSGPQAEDFSDSDDPFALFESWMSEAIRHEINDPNAMALATVDSGGLPNVRVVLLKQATPNGFVFYTNFESAKGHEILANPKASLCFHWKSLRRQIRIRGDIEVVDDTEADSYFASRPRGSRLGAWASQQSRPLESRFALEKAVAKYTAKHGMGKIPRPPYWSGFCLIPQEIEFWHDRPFRLHDRIVFSRKDPRSLWSKTRLYP